VVERSRVIGQVELGAVLLVAALVVESVGAPALDADVCGEDEPWIRAMTDVGGGGGHPGAPDQNAGPLATRVSGVPTGNPSLQVSGQSIRPGLLRTVPPFGTSMVRVTGGLVVVVVGGAPPGFGLLPEAGVGEGWLVEVEVELGAEIVLEVATSAGVEVAGLAALD
jgi:hypothetical protein